MFHKYLIILTCFCSAFPIFAEEGFIVESIGTTRNIDARKKIVETVLSSDEMQFWYRALSIVLDSGLIEPRGQMKWRIIRLSPQVRADSEFLQLLVHEVAHYIDIYSFISSGNRRDVSTQFYRISWDAPKTKKSGETLSSFISGYASTNQYEDFAETFTFYVFHNTTFSERALRNETLRKKYLFFANEVFPDWAFQDTDFSVGIVPGYLWDTTKVPVSVKKYLYFLAQSI
jgi:hypothetical protein